MNRRGFFLALLGAPIAAAAALKANPAPREFAYPMTGCPPLGLLGVPYDTRPWYPVATPLRNRIPRTFAGGTTLNFRRLTAINSRSWPV